MFTPTIDHSLLQWDKSMQHNWNIGDHHAVFILFYFFQNEMKTQSYAKGHKGSWCRPNSYKTSVWDL